MSRDYRKLNVFQNSDELALEIYKVTQGFPKSEMYAMTSQLRRAALSVPTNIVEGSHRNTMNDYLHFLDIAAGSLAETGYLIGFSQRLGYIENDTATALIARYESCIRMLLALINSLRIPRVKSPEPRA